MTTTRSCDGSCHSLTVGFCAMMAGPLTGASMNPARSLGPTLVGAGWRAHWIYWLAPITAMAVAAHVYDYLRRTADSSRHTAWRTWAHHAAAGSQAGLGNPGARRRFAPANAPQSSWSAIGRRSIRTVLQTVNIAADTPMPSARISRTAMGKLGVRRKPRSATRASLIHLSIPTLPV